MQIFKGFQICRKELLPIYTFFPKGYVEKAVIHLGVSAGDFEVDTTQPATTITTVPNEGFANVESGYIEVDIFKDEKRR